MLSNENKLVGVIFEGVKQLSLSERLSGVWRCLHNPGEDGGVMSVLSRAVSWSLYSSLSIIRSFTQTDPAHIIASQLFPPALFLVDTTSQDDIFQERCNKRRGCDRLKKFDCDNFKEFINNFAVIYSREILEFIQDNLCQKY